MNAGRRALLVVAAVALPPALVLGLILLLVNPIVGIVVFVVVAVALAGWVWTGAQRRVLKAMGGRPADAKADARALNLIEGLSFTAGLRQPPLLVVESDSLNVAVAGRDPASAVIVATRGLLTQLSRIELEGILAAALVEIRNGELGPATVVASLPGLGRRLVSSASGRDAATDLAAVNLTRFPPGLAAVLDKMDAKGTSVEGVRADQAHLWLADPLPPGAAPAGRTSLRDRAAALHEL